VKTLKIPKSRLQREGRKRCSTTPSRRCVEMMCITVVRQ
jgi:hypothetical protein